ncbi:telomere-binding protein [Raccoonpox virus]|uniref:Telomere-binding protein OPG082 n=1 Tax=Raccoon poxvirus TaxID=10256 RepID=A0A0G3G010_RACVI|nr:Telomere-Binding protein [Raccoonpox virus]AKJ93704.1 Telomere-Binding protein [Raccoonpox virus]AOP31336.1 telomere-binding protein [Raccoonpox virus]
MNNFVKQVASKSLKPTKKLTQLDETISLNECIIAFNFDNFYYCNDGLFSKPINTPEDVLKSLLVMESFAYEKMIIKGLIKILISKAYINDIYFTPFGWLTGVDDDPETDVVIKLIFNSSLISIKSQVIEYLKSYNVNNLSVLTTEKELNINTFNVPDSIPISIISFFPFDTDLIVIILFFGVCNDSYCGISYTSPKERLPYIIEILKPLVSEINMLSDEIGRTSSVRIFNSNSVKKFPTNTLTSICEIVYPFDESLFPTPKTFTPLNASPYIPKKIVSLLDLPSNVEIRAISRGGVDFITHINNKRLNTILVIAKDSFLKNSTFSGTFIKENIIWKGIYTYRIIKSSFPVPTIKTAISNKKKICKKHCFVNSQYTTRTLLHIL